MPGSEVVTVAIHTAGLEPKLRFSTKTELTFAARVERLDIMADVLMENCCGLAKRNPERCEPQFDYDENLLRQVNTPGAPSCLREALRPATRSARAGRRRDTPSAALRGRVWMSQDRRLYSGSDQIEGSCYW